MDIYFNQQQALRFAHRMAATNDKAQPVVAMLGGWAVPTADEFEFDCLGAEVVSVIDSNQTIH